MIKRIVHIDQNFPRRLSEQATKTGPNHDNWGFDTHAASNDLNGAINQEGSGKITSTSKSTLVDQLYADLLATDTQLTNLTNDNGQIRFNANVFNYIVHTEIDNIILKYEAPVVYTEGKYDVDTDEYYWKEHYLVLKGYDYHILFDILMHDPMGIDASCYEGWVRGVKFGQVNRKNNTPSDVLPKEQISYATFTDKDTAVSHSGTCPIDGKWITVHSTSKQSVSQEHFAIEKMIDPYNDTDTSYKITVQLSGQGYDSEYINTSDTKYHAWKTVIDDPESTEEAIVKAWEDCEGVKFKFFDVAGNVTYWVMPYIEIEVVTLEELYNMKKLILEFINTKPADLFLGTDLIGRTTIKVTNPNKKLADQPVLISLDKESIGEIYPSTRQKQFVLDDAHHKIASITTEDVGNIDESGWVVAHAEVDIEDFIDELDFARIMVRNLLRADGSLGEWIKECVDNTRKITLDPFVSQYLKETTNKNNAYYKFVKFTERYLNTMFKAYDKECYISVLEAIARIGNFNDYTAIYKNLLDKYDNDHGDMLHVTADDLTLLIDTDRQEPAENEA